MHRNPEPAKSDRREFLKTSAKVGALATTVTTTTVACANKESGDDVVNRKLKIATLDKAFKEAERLVTADITTNDGTFNLAQTLIHCAQSIEFSISGFPEHKSALFQRTVGSAAFHVFSWRGHMSHNLGEAIPGAPALDTADNPASALIRLDNAIALFQQSAPDLQPHFAYGNLSKAQYEQAHAMHLANHFSAIDA